MWMFEVRALSRVVDVQDWGSEGYRSFDLGKFIAKEGKWGGVHLHPS